MGIHSWQVIDQLVKSGDMDALEGEVPEVPRGSTCAGVEKPWEKWRTPLIKLDSKDWEVWWLINESSFYPLEL